MSNFYDELDRKVREARITRLFANRPENLHDYQGCANDRTMQREGVMKGAELKSEEGK
jgi:hypothetical protein